MCFRFGSCFGSGSGQDYGRSTPKTTHRGGGGHWGSLADHGYYSGTDLKTAYRQPATDDKAVDNDGGAQKDHAGNPGGYTPYVQGKADSEASKHPAAWTSKVGDDAGHAFTARLPESATADHREQAAVDYHQYPTTTTTTISRYEYGRVSTGVNQSVPFLNEH